jgi:hypothetical protein
MSVARLIEAVTCPDCNSLPTWACRDRLSCDPLDNPHPARVNAALYAATAEVAGLKARIGRMQQSQLRYQAYVRAQMDRLRAAASTAGQE